MRGLVSWQVESKCSASKQQRSEARDSQWCKQAADARVQREVRSKRLSVVRPLAREASAVVSTTVLARLPHPVRGGRSFAGVPVPPRSHPIPDPGRSVGPGFLARARGRNETETRRAFFCIAVVWVLQSYNVFFFGPQNTSKHW